MRKTKCDDITERYRNVKLKDNYLKQFKIDIWLIDQ